MKILSLILMVLMVGCGNDYSYETVVQNAEEQDRLIYSGYFNLNGASETNCIYLDEKIPNVVDLESDCQNLITFNPENGTIGQFPRVTASGLLVINGEINYSRDLNYTDGHDIEEDESGDNVRGKRRTDFNFSFDKNGRLVIKIKVYANATNDNLNFVVVKRTFRQVN